MPSSRSKGTVSSIKTSSIRSALGGRQLFTSRTAAQKKHTHDISTHSNAFANLADNDEDSVGPSREIDEDDDVDVTKVRSEVHEIFGASASSGGPKVPETIAEEAAIGSEVQTQGWETVRGRDNRDDQKPKLGPVWRRRVGEAFTASNWRAGRTLNASGYTAPKIADARSYARVGRTNYTGAPVGDGVNVADLYPGAIVWHADVRECHDPNATAKDGEELFKSPKGQDIIRKGRYFVITKVCERHYNELPMYGYNRLGITKKHEKIKKQHVGIRPLHVTAAEYKKQNGLAPLEVGVMKDPKEQIHDMTVLHFMEQRSSPFDTPMRLVGYLKPGSVERLPKLQAETGC